MPTPASEGACVEQREPIIRRDPNAGSLELCALPESLTQCSVSGRHLIWLGMIDVNAHGKLDNNVGRDKTQLSRHTRSSLRPYRYDQCPEDQVVVMSGSTLLTIPKSELRRYLIINHGHGWTCGKLREVFKTVPTGAIHKN